MENRPSSQKLNLVFAWAGALTGLSFALSGGLRFANRNPHASIALLPLLASTLALLLLLRRLEARAIDRYLFCGMLGLLCSSITYLFVM